MNRHFYKYQGAGNDFIIIDARSHDVELSQKEIEWLCNRRFGIGADGLMIIKNDPNVDFNMRYFNADGNEGTLCGNGGRCIVAYAARNGKSHFTFSAIDGIHNAQVLDYHGHTQSLDNHECAQALDHYGHTLQIRLGMNEVENVHLYGEEGYFLDTGSPHLVLFQTDLLHYEVATHGAFWRNHPDFSPKGTNVNFVEIEPDGTLFVRTFERGVEDETFACGTGVTASAIAAYLRTKDSVAQKLDKNHIHNIDKNHTYNIDNNHTYNVKVLGGHLQVSFQTDGVHFSHIKLTGPATFVFEGYITTQ